MATITFGAVNGNWSDATKWVGGVKPTTGDDVLVTAASGNLAVNEATAALNSFNCTTYTGTLSGSSDITVTVASGTSTVLFAGTSPTWSGILKLNPAAGTTINLTMGSLTTAGTIGGITIAGTTTGAVYFLDAVTMAASNTVTLTSGTLHTDGASDNSGLTHSWGLFSSSNSNTRALYLGNSTIGITGAGTAWTMATATNATMDKGTSTINFSGSVSNTTITAGAGTNCRVFNTVNFTNIGNTTLSDGFIFNTLTRTGTNIKTDSLILGANIIVYTNLTLAGNSATNRLWVRSDTLGTAKTFTISSATISVNNVDFRDITFARSDAGALDLSAGGTTSVGDCGGNSKTLGDSSTLTMTTADTETVTGTTGNWDVATWTGGSVNRVPLPQDTVVISLTAGQTLTANMPRLGKDISFTTATNFTLGNAVTSYGSLDLTNAGTFTHNSSQWTFESQARTGTQTLISNGKTFLNVSFAMAGIAVLSLGDAFLTAGNITCQSTNSLSLNSFTHTTTNSNTANVFTGAGTIDAGTSTIAITNTGANAKTFVGGGKTYYNLTTPSGTGGVAITGANTFNHIIPAAGGKLTLPSTVTTTVSNFVAIGSVGNVITLLASTGGSAATLNMVGVGAIQTDWINITDVNVTPTSAWYYGGNSTWNSGTGWNAGSALRGRLTTASTLW